MTDNDSKRRPVASLTDLLAEHTRIAEQERQEIESRLREKEEEERRRREEEERRQKELLQQRLEEEKRRAQERFQRQQGRETAGEAAPAVAIPIAPLPAVAAAPQQKGHTLLAVAATVVLMAGAAVGAYFLFFADHSADLSVMGHQGGAVVAEAARQAEVLNATHAANVAAAQQSEKIAGLEQQLATAAADIDRLKSEMSDAQKAAADARKAAEEAAAAAAATGNGKGNGHGKKQPKRDGDGGGGIRVKTGIFEGKTIVE